MMIVLDNGDGLKRLLRRVVASGRRGVLYVVVPFIDHLGRLWQDTLVAARKGVKVRLVTRTPADAVVAEEIDELRSCGARTLFVEKLHAKAVLWKTAKRRERAAFVGSLNFTCSSECTALELGLLITGGGIVEELIYRDLTHFVARLDDALHTRFVQVRRTKVAAVRHSPRSSRKEIRCL